MASRRKKHASLQINYAAPEPKRDRSPHITARSHQTWFKKRKKNKRLILDLFFCFLFHSFKRLTYIYENGLAVAPDQRKEQTFCIITNSKRCFSAFFLINYRAND